MKQFKGKAIYNPSGKAGEYSQWACNFYVGCSNGCEYCYCKKGILAKAMGMDEPQLKKCFKSEEDAMDIFKKEVIQNLTELQEHGLFFSFTTDPMLPETIELTKYACQFCNDNWVPVKILTKRTDMIYDFVFDSIMCEWDRSLFAIGFTLTGHDELEPNASPNQERIEAMRKLHKNGWKTFASIEPIIDFESAIKMIELSMDFCDLYKIGLMSGSKVNIEKLRSFVHLINWYSTVGKGFKIYWKDSVSKFFDSNMWEEGNIVERDYNLFKN